MDPRKYTSQVDWKKETSDHPTTIPHEKKISVFDKIAKDKRYIPGPCHYLKKPKPNKTKLMIFYY